MPIMPPSNSNKETNEKFVTNLGFHCDSNDSYEITMNGYQARKINKMKRESYISLDPESRIFIS